MIALFVESSLVNRTPMRTDVNVDLKRWPATPSMPVQPHCENLRIVEVGPVPKYAHKPLGILNDFRAYVVCHCRLTS